MTQNVNNKKTKTAQKEEQLRGNSKKKFRFQAPSVVYEWIRIPEKQRNEKQEYSVHNQYVIKYCKILNE